MASLGTPERSSSLLDVGPTTHDVIIHKDNSLRESFPEQTRRSLSTLDVCVGRIQDDNEASGIQRHTDEEDKRRQPGNHPTQQKHQAGN